MLHHIDSIWVKYNDFQKNSGAAGLAQERESGGLSQRQETARDSDLVTLLNLEDSSDDHRE